MSKKKTVTIDITKLKHRVECTLLVTLILSLPLSVMNAMMPHSTCETYGYYLPVTFVMCHINEKRNSEE